MEKTMTEIIDEVREEMCAKYCKYAEKAGALPFTEILKECEKCPLNRL